MTIFNVLLLLAILADVVFCAQTPPVNTDKGAVIGFTENVYDKNVNIFLGIPYAKPPLKKLRFRPPEPADKWAKIYATKEKPACPQKLLYHLIGPGVEITDTDENCLFLNVYVPGTIQSAKQNPLAVIVFFHGGAYQTASSYVWDGRTLARYGNVVFVSVNFRLGVLGFLSTEDSAAAGNWGLLDQRLALKWIQDNIEQFGGDKTKVTIFGHASGAYSVGLHILSPMSTGLFARAISEAGPLAYQAWLNPHLRARVKPLAMMTKCSPKGSSTFDSQKVVDCLRNVPIKELLKHDAMTPGHFVATVDKKFLLDDPVKILSTRPYNPVEFIMGANTDEGSAFAKAIPDFYKGTGINKTTYEKNVAQIASFALKKPLPQNAAAALTSAMSSEYYPMEETDGKFRRSYLDVLAGVMVSKMFQTAELYSAKLKPLVFYFTHKPSTSKFPKYVGPGHSEELKFIFGYILKNGTEAEKRLSKDWMKTWGDFARTGSAKFNGGSLSWIPFASSTKNYLEITTNMTNDNNKEKWKPKIRNFWDVTLPKIAQLGATTPPPTNTGGCDHKVNWGLSQTGADAVFIFMVIMCFFMLFVLGAIGYVLYRSKIYQQLKYVKQENMSSSEINLSRM